MKNSRKKAGCLLLSALLATSAFATGCSSSSDSSAASASTDDTKATTEATTTAAKQEEASIVFASGKDTGGAIAAMIKEFQIENPNITVDFQELPGASDDIKKSVMTSLAAGDDDPDVLALDIIWVSQFASAGWLMDVTSDVNAIKDKYLGGPISTCFIGDKAYAFPDYTDVGLLYYRTDIITTPPKTWDELITMANEHKGEGGTEYGYVFQAFQGEPVVCNALEFIKQNGGTDLVDGKFSINSTQTIDALKFMRKLIDDGISPEGVLTHKPNDSLAIFSEGKSIFMRNWTYAYSCNSDPASKIQGKVGVAPLPVGPTGTESSGTLGGWNLGINTYTDEKDAAIKFASFISGEKGQKIRATNTGTFPVLEASYSDADILKVLPHLTSCASAVDEAKPRPQVDDYPAISSIMQPWFHKALTGDASYEDALTGMTNEVNALLSKQK